MWEEFSWASVCHKFITVHTSKVKLLLLSDSSPALVKAGAMICAHKPNAQAFYHVWCSAARQERSPSTVRTLQPQAWWIFKSTHHMCPSCWSAIGFKLRDLKAADFKPEAFALSLRTGCSRHYSRWEENLWPTYSERHDRQVVGRCQ